MDGADGRRVSVVLRAAEGAEITALTPSLAQAARAVAQVPAAEGVRTWAHSLHHRGTTVRFPATSPESTLYLRRSYVSALT